MTLKAEPLPFADQPVLITGASAGIGFACAQTLARAGARHLILTARNSERLAAAKERLLAEADLQVDTLVCDHSQRADLDAAIAELSGFITLVENIDSTARKG